MAGGFFGWIERGLPPGLHEDPDRRRRAVLAKGIALFVIGTTGILGVILVCVLEGDPRWLSLTYNSVLCGLAALTLGMIRRGRLELAGHWIAGLLGVSLVFAMIVGGGVRAPWGVALPTVPMIAAVIAGRRAGLLWAALCGLSVVVIAAFELVGVEFSDLNSPEINRPMRALALVTVIMVIIWISAFSEELKARAIERVEEAAEQRDRALAEEERAKIAAGQAIAANAAKRAFLATMSHELRTPLNAIIGYSELVEEELGEGLGDHTESLRRIRGAGEHLLHLISDILELARMEADRLVLNPERFRVDELLGDLAATLQPLASKRGNAIVTRCDPGVATIVHDRVRLRQVLINLLGNAIKFTRDGMITLSARRTADRERLVIAVIDTGVGIPSERLASIFDSFVQVDSSFSRSYEGSGLGLAIVRQLCGLMGGEVRASSTLGEGTAIEVRLPVVAPEPRPPRVEPRAGNDGASGSPSGPFRAEGPPASASLRG